MLILETCDNDWGDVTEYGNENMDIDPKIFLTEKATISHNKYTIFKIDYKEMCEPGVSGIKVCSTSFKRYSIDVIISEFTDILYRKCGFVFGHY